ncbi:hypothetical protein ED28_16145 [[Pantoea] beijingensis]|uniref:Uncharacterized protein n=1 Tax=[Pantoea] beijingensis TaxID=1324864 RepID=A0A443IA57_9GAMM|nr:MULTISPECIES: type III secretion system gatekeeper subunit SctW [Erwiniaceae]RWR00979.1 hypothetical protein ED28_16145 [[Pantoea] beijingensis]
MRINHPLPKIHHHHPTHTTGDKQDEIDVRESNSSNDARTANKVKSPEGEFAEVVAKGGSQLAEAIENRLKLNEQRITNTRPAGRLRIAVDKIERLAELYQLLDDRPSETQNKQHAAINALTSREAPASPEEYLSAANDDPVIADTLLRISLEKAQKKQDSAAVEKIQLALATLSSKFGEQIVAGVNTAAAISLFSTQPEQKQAMRQIYYNSVIGQQSSGAIFDALLDKFGKEGFVPALRTLQRALADDIAAFAPSMTPVALRKVLNGLNDTRTITHTMAAVDTLLQRLNNKYPHISLDGSQLTRRLLNLTQNGFKPQDIANLGLEVVGQQPHHQSVFFNQLLSLLQKLPATLWREEKNRGGALAMLRTLIGEYATWEQKTTRKTKYRSSLNARS